MKWDNGIAVIWGFVIFPIIGLEKWIIKSVNNKYIVKK